METPVGKATKPRTKAAAPGKIYANFLLKCILASFGEFTKQWEPSYDPKKYTIVFAPKVKGVKTLKYPVSFSMDFVGSIERIHAQLYHELKECTYATNTTVADIAKFSAEETTNACFEFVYNTVKDFHASLGSNIVLAMNGLSDDGYVQAIVLNIVGTQRPSIAGAITETILMFDKILSYHLALYAWHVSSMVNQNCLRMTLATLRMSAVCMEEVKYIVEKKTPLHIQINTALAAAKSVPTLNPEDALFLQTIGTPQPFNSHTEVNKVDNILSTVFDF